MEVLIYVVIDRVTKLNTNPHPIVTSDCQGGRRKAKQRTSLDMKQGTHFRHWNAGHLDDTIAGVDTSLANIPDLTGYSPLWWQNGVNKLIPKEAGNFKMGRLRPILLFEVSFTLTTRFRE